MHARALRPDPSVPVGARRRARGQRSAQGARRRAVFVGVVMKSFKAHAHTGHQIAFVCVCVYDCTRAAQS